MGNTYTVALFATLLTDRFHPQPPSKSQNDVLAFCHPYMMDIFNRYYPQHRGDAQNHWNYDVRFAMESDFGEYKTKHLEFRDRTTWEINDRQKYRDICNAQKIAWKHTLMQAYPGYDREDIEEAMEYIRYEYFSSAALIVGFTLLEKLVARGEEDLMTEAERAALQTYQPGTAFR